MQFIDFYCNIAGIVVIRELKLTIQQITAYIVMLNGVDTVKSSEQHQQATIISIEILQ